jgi:intracellular septation protein
MGWIRRRFPFNAEQSINILSEFGPLITMFVMNAAYGIEAGTIALIVATVIAILTMLIVLRRLPIFPLIASAVTITFGALTLITHDPMWVQIKVTIFNLLFSLVLFYGLWRGKNFFKYVFDKTFHYTKEGWDKFTWNFAWFFIFTAVANEVVRQGFTAESMFDVFGFKLDGVNIWIMFKLVIIMPLTGIFAWWQTKAMQKYRLPEPRS